MAGNLSVQHTNQISLGCWEPRDVCSRHLRPRDSNCPGRVEHRNAHGLKSTAYSALLASLLYEQLDKELRRTQADEVDKQNVLTKAIDCCRQAAGSSAEDAVNVLRAVLELLETGVPAQVNVTPQERRAQLRVIQGSLSSTSKAVVSSSKAQLREIG